MTREEIGSVLRQLRISSGKTQKEVAEIIGRTQQIVGHWETGYSQPDANTLFTLCDIYGATVDEAFGFKKHTLSQEDLKLLKKYRSLDLYGQETINIVLDRESSRTKTITEKDSRIRELEFPDDMIDNSSREAPMHLTEYFCSASAGSNIFILGNKGATKISISESDWDSRVDYVISISGDSMEPEYNDGDKVMVSQRMKMLPGDVGIFVINGNVYIKEYGETELISRNPNSPNIKISEYDNIVCMGRVIKKLEGPYKIINN